MDFHSLSRKDLQALCKKNKIPANITNVAMADALQALQIVEGIEELQQLRSQPESPERTEERSPDLPRTCRRTSARRVRASKDSVLSKENEPKDLPQSPIHPTRTRHGTATKASTARRRVCKKEETTEKEESSDSHQILSENNGSEIPKTPSEYNGRKRATGTSIRRKIETQADEKENENPVATGLRTCTRRSARLSGLQDTAPPSIQKTRGRKQVIKIASLSEESEESEVKSEEGFERSDPEKLEQDSSADLVLQKLDGLIIDEKHEDLPKIEEFNGEKRESDPIADDCEGKKCDSEPMADADLPRTDDCITDPSSDQNLVSGDAAVVLLPSDNTTNVVAAELEDPKPENFSATKNQLLSDSVAVAESDHELKFPNQCDSEPTADPELPSIDDSITDPSSDQNLVPGDAAAVLEDPKPENFSATENQLLSDSVLQDCKESNADPDADADLDLDIDPVESLKTDGSLIDQEASEDVFCSEGLIESPKQNEKLGENMTESSDVELKTACTIDILKEGGESGNSIADSSSSVGSLMMNPECENSDSEQLEHSNLSSYMKNLTLDCEDQSVENVASAQFSIQALIPDEIMHPKNNTMDPDCFCDNANVAITSELPDQSLIGTPASLQHNNVGVSRSGNLLGSKSRSKLRLSNKKAMPIKSNILEDDVDKENMGGGESLKRETKVNNKGADKEHQKGGSLNDMSMRQLKKLYKDITISKNEMVKRSALQAVNQNCQSVESGN